MADHTRGLPTWITNGYLQDALRKHYEDDDVTVISYEASPGSSVGDNYLCQISRLKTTLKRRGRQQTLSIICKHLQKCETMDKITQNFDIFRTEFEMLTDVLPRLSEVLPNDAETFFPGTYFTDLERRALFLEDLCDSGFRMAEKGVALDLDHSLLMIRALARLHGGSYLLVRKDPSLKQKFQNYFYRPANADFLDKTVGNSFAGVLDSLDTWPISEELKKSIRDLRETSLQKMFYVYARREESVNVLLHADCWRNNILFGYDQTGKVDSIRLLDFQASNYNSHVLDLHYYIFTTGNVHVKTKHLRTLLEEYYRTFIAITNDIPGYDFDAFLREFHGRLFFGFICMIFFFPLVLAPPDTKALDLEKVTKGDEEYSNKHLYWNQSYIEAMVKTLPYFAEHGVI